MGLALIYSELQNLLMNFPVDSKEDIVSFLEDLSSDVNDTRNVLGMYEHDTSHDGIAERMADDLIDKMAKKIKAFNADMIETILRTEVEYRLKIKKK